MHDVLRFWLDRGVDGFRVDVIWHIVKDDHFRDNPRNAEYKPGQNPHHEFVSTYEADQPEVHTIIREMRQVLDAYASRMMVGEVYLPVQRLVTYYGEGGGGVHMPFNFQLVTMPWNARAIGEAVQGYEASLPPYGWPNWVLGNHDNHRIATRIGAAQARVAAMLLLTLRGTPTMYYGDEIGMRDAPIPPDRVQDPFEKNVPGLGLGRDPERTPMQWDGSANAGFTRPGVRPWLPLAADFAQTNVAAQRGHPGSILSLYRQLLALRRSEPALAYGTYHPVDTHQAHDDVLAYRRRHGDREFLVVLNLSAQAKQIETRDETDPLRKGRIVLSTHLDRGEESIDRSLNLRPDEGLIVSLSEPA
jgi:alpha-glucosidase